MRAAGALSTQASPGEQGADRALVRIVLPIFIVLLVVVVARHEMWRDEIEAWNVALRSASVPALFQNIRYNGHGALWYLVLFPIARVTSDPRAMQLFHVVLAAATAGVLLAYFPVGRLCRILLAFGYFCFFEYATISRHYALGFLLTILFCAVAIRRPDSILLQVLLLVLLAQVHVYGVILSISLAACQLARLAELRRSGRVSEKVKRRYAAAALLFAAGLAVAVRQLIPPPDSGFDSSFLRLSKKQLLQTLSTPWRGLVPIPKVQLDFWNTNVLDGPPVGSFFQATVLQAALAILVCGFLVVLHARRPAPLMFVVLAYGGLLLFTYLKYLGDVRHHGHYWIALIAAHWLWVFSEDRLPSGRLSRSLEFLERSRYRALILLCAVGFAVGVGANATDLVRTFSSSGDAARFLKANFPPDTPVVGDRNYLAAAVAMHLNRQFFYTMGERWGISVTWQASQMRFAAPDEVFRDVERLRRETRRDVLVLLSYPARGPLARYEEVARFPAGIVPDERYFLYIARFGRAP